MHLVQNSLPTKVQCLPTFPSVLLRRCAFPSSSSRRRAHPTTFSPARTRSVREKRFDHVLTHNFILGKYFYFLCLHFFFGFPLRSARWAPMPELAPVTSATLPLHRSMLQPLDNKIKCYWISPFFGRGKNTWSNRGHQRYSAPPPFHAPASGQQNEMLLDIVFFLEGKKIHGPIGCLVEVLKCALANLSSRKLLSNKYRF